MLGPDDFLVDGAHPDLGVIDAKVREQLLHGQALGHIGLDVVADEARHAALRLAMQLYPHMHARIV